MTSAGIFQEPARGRHWRVGCHTPWRGRMGLQRELENLVAWRFHMEFQEKNDPFPRGLPSHSISTWGLDPA